MIDKDDGLITAKELDNAKITTHRFGEGYDIDEVDDLLDRAANTIRVLNQMIQDSGNEGV
jgi:DivIVA domain-containing protein